jgi:hypothetical protein
MQDLMIELQRASAQSSSSPSDDDGVSGDDNDDDDDDGNGDDNAGDEDDRDHSHNLDNSTESTTISCPHPDCKDKPPYSKKNNLQRHFTNRILHS